MSSDIVSKEDEKFMLRIAEATFADGKFEVDVESNTVMLFVVLNVVASGARHGLEIEETLAQRLGLETEIGDELLFQLFYLESDKERALEQHQKYGEAYDFEAAYNKAGPLRSKRMPKRVSGAAPVPY